MTTTRTRFVFLIAFLCIAVLCFAGCGNRAEITETVTEAPTEPPIASTPSVQYGGTVQEFLEWPDETKVTGYELEKYATDRCNYLFEKRISEEERNAFIEQEERLLATLNVEDKIKCCVFRNGDYAGFTDGNGTCYLTIGNTATPMQAQATLRALSGKQTHYGMLFGLSNLLSRELAWTEDAVIPCPEESAISFFSDPANSDLLELTAPCFSTYYYDEASIEQVERLANGLVQDCAANYGIAEVVSWLRLDAEALYEKLTEAENAYLASLGCTQQVAFDDLYTYDIWNGDYYMTCSTPHIDWYINKEAEFDGTYTSLDMFHSYADLKEVLRQTEQVLDELDALLDMGNTMLEHRCDVILTSHELVTAGYQYGAVGGYTMTPYHSGMNKSKIYTYHPIVVAHEYLHSMQYEIGWDRFEDLAVEKSKNFTHNCIDYLVSYRTSHISSEVYRELISKDCAALDGDTSAFSEQWQAVLPELQTFAAQYRADMAWDEIIELQDPVVAKWLAVYGEEYIRENLYIDGTITDSLFRWVDAQSGGQIAQVWKMGIAEGIPAYTDYTDLNEAITGWIAYLQQLTAE